MIFGENPTNLNIRENTYKSMLKFDKQMRLQI